MDVILDDQFQKVETALNLLIESITKFNPSTTAAADLIAADEELTQGLEQLAQHQANHARILRLRQTAENLDHQIKSTITLLADTRKELLDTPLASFPTESRDVPFDELLQYAKNISKFTVPPTFRPPVDANEGEKKSEDAKPESSNSPENGTGTSAPLQDDGGELGRADGQKPEDRGVGWASLTEEQRQWLDQISSVPFVPWPKEDVVKAGALSAIHGMIDRGEDPGQVMGEDDVRPPVQPAAEGLTGNGDDGEDGSRDARREAHAATQRTAKPPQAFVGFGLYNPDDDA